MLPGSIVQRSFDSFEFPIGFYLFFFSFLYLVGWIFKKKKV